MKRILLSLLLLVAALSVAPLQAQAVFPQPDNLTLAPASVSSAATIFTQRTDNYESVVWTYSSIGAGNTVSQEASLDGQNWVAVTCSQLGTSNAALATSHSPSTTALFTCEVPSKWFRLRVSTYGSGTVTLNANFRKSVVPSFIKVAGVNQQQIDTFSTGPAMSAQTATVSSATNLFTITTGVYRSASLQFTSIGSGNQFIVESSGDNVNWVNVAGTLNNAAGGWGNGASGPTLTDDFVWNLSQPFYRVRISTYSSGSITGYLTLNSHTAPPAGVTVATANAVSALFVTPAASAQTTGGPTMFTLTAAATTNATNIKASAGNLYHVEAHNISTTGAWLSLYNTAGAPTCGTGIVWQGFVSPTPAAAAGQPYVADFAVPLAFTTGIGMCLTTGIAGTGAVAATTYQVNVAYK